MEVKIKYIDYNGKSKWERRVVASIESEFGKLLLLSEKYSDITIQQYPLINHKVHCVIKDGQKQKYKPAPKYHVVSFSGGKDSTAMLLKMIELKYDIDEIVFCDTGLEFDEMYELDFLLYIKHIIIDEIALKTKNELESKAAQDEYDIEVEKLESRGKFYISI